MYTSNSNANTTFSDFDTNPSSRIQDLSSSSYLFHLPSPLIHYEDEAVYLQQFHDILHQNDQDVVEANETIVVPNMADCTRNGVIKKNLLNGGNNQQIPRKRSYKKDRHSKINTAHGPRDRRMRLSLDVARKFFGLQDMLGFDKASKTVEWLLTKSKIAIKEVTKGFPQMEHSSSIVSNSGASSTSEWEVLSNEPEIATKTVMTSTCPKEKKVKGVRKATFHPVVKESREKKRARARERTREKNKRQLGDQSKHYCTKAANLGSWSSFENGEESVGNKNNPPSFEVQGIPNHREQRQQIQGTREGTVGDSLFVNGNWSPSPFYNYQHNSGISDEHQFTDFQFYGKLWEG